MAEPDERSQRRWRGRKGSKSNQSEPYRHVGRIKNYNHDKGFGFIDCPLVEKDIFVHQKQINGFQIGDRVCFTVTEDVRGMKAVELEYAPDVNDQENWPVGRSDSRRGWDQKEHQDTYEGRISFIDETKGFGYIDGLDAFSEDRDGSIYVERRHLKGFNVGDRVQYHRREHREGGHQAVLLRCASSSASAAPHAEDGIRDDILKRLWQRETIDISDDPQDADPASSTSYGASRMSVDQENDRGHEQTHGMGYDPSTGADEPLYQGVIKMFDAEKGYGFIHCPAIGGDVYVPKVHLKGMKVGQPVNFAIREYRGKPQAHCLSICEEEVDGAALIMDGLSPTQSSSSSRKDPYRGVVKTFDQEKGYGFISCKEVQEKYGVDTFVHQKGLARKLTDLAPGDHVSFFIRLDRNRQDGKERPQALKVCRCEAPSEACAPVDKGPSHVGSIKSFDDTEGYGFISCPEVLEQYKRDAFVHNKQIKEFKPGDSVLFYVRENNLGHPQAYDLKKAPSTLAWLGDTSILDEPGGEELPPVEKEEYLGKIKSFNDKQGYGFIHCETLHEQYGRDVFIPQSQYNGLNIGDRVSFRVQVKRGQPQAHDVVCVMTRTVSARRSELLILDGATRDKKLLRACASARVDSVDEVDELLEAGANPNIRDVTGQTSVMIAALNVRHSERKCRLLIQAGAKIDISSSKTENGQTVLQWSRERINPTFAAFLEACAKGDPPDCNIELSKPPGDEF